MARSEMKIPRSDTIAKKAIASLNILPFFVLYIVITVKKSDFGEKSDFSMV